MKRTDISTVVGGLLLAVALSIGSAAQQDSAPAQNNAGQSSQPGGSGTGAASSAPYAGMGTASKATPTGPEVTAKPKSGDDNPYDPVLEPPPLPRGKATLIGGTATHVDHVRNRLTVAPFGGGSKVKLIVDERSHIYRDGAPTTVLGIHKGDRVYADTLLDGSKILAENVRVITEPGIAEVRGQVVGRDPSRGTISVRDQLSSRLVSFSVSGATKYSATKGDANATDVQVGSLVDVQFSPERGGRDVAEEIKVLAKPGDNYVFSGTVTHLDMRSNTLALDNRSDEQTYDLHFDPAQMQNPRGLKVGSEVTARAVFDGMEYRTSNLRVEESSGQEKGQLSNEQ